MSSRALSIALVFSCLFSFACGVVTESTESSAPDTTRVMATEQNDQPDSGQRSHGEGDAPEFNLTLSQGNTFTLSQGEKPLYMVFWAEW